RKLFVVEEISAERDLLGRHAVRVRHDRLRKARRQIPAVRGATRRGDDRERGHELVLVAVVRGLAVRKGEGGRKRKEAGSEDRRNRSNRAKYGGVVHNASTGRYRPRPETGHADRVAQPRISTAVFSKVSYTRESSSSAIM